MFERKTIGPKSFTEEGRTRKALTLIAVTLSELLYEAFKLTSDLGMDFSGIITDVHRSYGVFDEFLDHIDAVAVFED